MPSIYKNKKKYGGGAPAQEYTAGDGIQIENHEVSIDEMASADMPEIVTPLPAVMSRRMKYSTEEQVVGEWIDGKPLYQKTVNIVLSEKSTITADRQWTVLQDLSSLNPDEIFIVGGFIHLDNDSAPLTAYTQSTDNTYWMTRIWDKKIHVLSCGNSWYKQGLGVKGYVIVTIQYTKTTD